MDQTSQGHDAELPPLAYTIRLCRALVSQWVTSGSPATGQAPRLSCAELTYKKVRDQPMVNQISGAVLGKNACRRVDVIVCQSFAHW